MVIVLIRDLKKPTKAFKLIVWIIKLIYFVEVQEVSDMLCNLIKQETGSTS